MSNKSRFGKHSPDRDGQHTVALLKNIKKLDRGSIDFICAIETTSVYSSGVPNIYIRTPHTHVFLQFKSRWIFQPSQIKYYQLAKKEHCIFVFLAGTGFYHLGCGEKTVFRVVNMCGEGMALHAQLVAKNTLDFIQYISQVK